MVCVCGGGCNHEDFKGEDVPDVAPVEDITEASEAHGLPVKASLLQEPRSMRRRIKDVFPRGIVCTRLFYSPPVEMKMRVIKVVLIRRCSFLESLWRRWVEPEWRREVCGVAGGTVPARGNGNRVFALRVLAPPTPQ